MERKAEAGLKKDATTVCSGNRSYSDGVAISALGGEITASDRKQAEMEFTSFTDGLRRISPSVDQ